MSLSLGPRPPPAGYPCCWEARPTCGMTTKQCPETDQLGTHIQRPSGVLLGFPSPCLWAFSKSVFSGLHLLVSSPVAPERRARTREWRLQDAGLCFSKRELPAVCWVLRGGDARPEPGRPPAAEGPAGHPKARAEAPGAMRVDSPQRLGSPGSSAASADLGWPLPASANPAVC